MVKGRQFRKGPKAERRYGDFRCDVEIWKGPKETEDGSEKVRMA